MIEEEDSKVIQRDSTINWSKDIKKEENICKIKRETLEDERSQFRKRELRREHREGQAAMTRVDRCTCHSLTPLELGGPAQFGTSWGLLAGWNQLRQCVIPSLHAKRQNTTQGR